MVDELIRFGIPGELMIVIISALPILELRGGIPAGIGIFQLPWYQALCLAIIGNLIPVPFLLLFFQALVKCIRRARLGEKLVNPLVRHTERHTAAIEKYERIGLMVFVAIPLPWTGAWTGAMAASLLGMKFRRAFFSIMAGVIISGAIVTTLFQVGWVGAVIAGLGLCGLAIMGLWKT
ncbi:MAG: small multi-drug export protein [Chloroflexi bacterium]|nr:small multi-drug export protein [Chloroflexota bacterium]